jgi:hypothetical protein
LFVVVRCDFMPNSTISGVTLDAAVDSAAASME